MNFEEIVQRAVNTEAKAGLKSSIMVQDLDIRCLRNYRIFNSSASKVQTQETIAKNSSSPKKPKTKETKSVRTDVAEPLEQDKKDKKDRWNKKRRFREHRWDHTEEQKKQTPATSTNVTDAGSKKKYANITCYNYDKKGHYLKSCPKPPRN